MTATEPNLLSAATDVRQRLTTLRTTFVTADTIGLEYQLMPGTQPEAYGARAAIWQTGDTIPWDIKPLDQPLGRQEIGSVSFTDLTVQNNSYMLALLVGPVRTESQKVANAVASVWVPRADEEPVVKSTFLNLTYVGTSSVAVQLNGLTGYTPQTDGAWLGMWRGETASHTRMPDWSIPIRFDGAFGTASFNNVSIGLGLSYTIGFFPTGWSDDPSARNQKVLATSLTFRQGSI